MTDETNSTQEEQAPADPCKTQPDTPPSTSPPKAKCKPLDEGSNTPCLELPPPCPQRPQHCCCPDQSGTTGTCPDIESLIDRQTEEITQGDRAKVFKAELEDLLRKANSAKQEYTQEKYKDLRERWEKQDGDIADLLKKLVCAVPCWWCLIECEICPLIYTIRNTELELNGDGTLIEKVYSQRDLRYWHERNREAKKAVFDRIKLTLVAWEKPAQTIDKALTNNAKLIEDTKKILGTDPATSVWNIFMIFLPMHMAIAPRDAVSKIVSKIPPEYLKFCECDVGTTDSCCGPDVGKWTIRQQLIGPQPYIVEPGMLMGIICCLVQERYLPANDLLAQAESELAKIEADIARKISAIEQKKASIAADFKANVASPIDCDKYKRKGGTGQSSYNPCGTSQTSAQTAR
jgi:hypothetical protein